MASGLGLSPAGCAAFLPTQVGAINKDASFSGRCLPKALIWAKPLFQGLVNPRIVLFILWAVMETKPVLISPREVP